MVHQGAGTPPFYSSWPKPTVGNVFRDLQAAGTEKGTTSGAVLNNTRGFLSEAQDTLCESLVDEQPEGVNFPK